MQTIIQLDNITAGYDGREQIHDVSMDVGDRDFIVITGPNGSGKTTLIRVMLGLLKPMRGTVSFPAEGRPDGWKPRFGYLPQYSAIDRYFPINVGDTVLSGLNGTKKLCGRTTDSDRQAVAMALEQLELTTLTRRPIQALSGGQLQRVLMARAIVAKPDVLILDEPTTYTDPTSWKRMHDIIGNLSRERAVVMVSHDAEFISRLCPTKTLHIERGTIINVTSGKPNARR